VNGSCESSPAPDCVTDADCLAGETCVNGFCESSPAPDCVYDADCLAGEVCVNGFCEVAGGGSGMTAFLGFGAVDTLSQTVEVTIENSDPVAGFQFSIVADSSFSITGAAGGLAEANGFQLNVGAQSGIILGFSTSATFIPAGTGTLVLLSYAGYTLNDVCLGSAIVSAPGGVEFTVTLGSCITLPAFDPGDVNRDGMVDVVDVVELISAVLSIQNPTPNQLVQYDLNLDDSLDVVDVVLLVEIVLYGPLGRIDSTFNDSSLEMSGDAVIITGNDNIAGVQLSVSGEYQLDGSTLPADWEMHTSADKIILIHVGTSYTDQLAFGYTGDLSVDGGIVVGWNARSVVVEASVNHPAQVELQSAYPNPFNPQTSLQFSLIEPTQVTLSVYNVLGEKVATLKDGPMNSGQHQVTWDASNFTSGMYFVVLNAGGERLMQRVTLVK